MDPARLIAMLLRRFLTGAVNKSAERAMDDALPPEERKRARRARRAARRARKAARLIRRSGRF